MPFTHCHTNFLLSLAHLSALTAKPSPCPNCLADSFVHIIYIQCEVKSIDLFKFISTSTAVPYIEIQTSDGSVIGQPQSKENELKPMAMIAAEPTEQSLSSLMGSGYNSLSLSCSHLVPKSCSVTLDICFGFGYIVWFFSLYVVFFTVSVQMVFVSSLILVMYLSVSVKNEVTIVPWTIIEFHVVVPDHESEVNSPKRLRIESRKFLPPLLTSTRNGKDELYNSVVQQLSVDGLGWHEPLKKTPKSNSHLL
uniref:Uncharacterized protein n=1 Tax=Amphimedon queenslandica TaxID=400682 RepID=A0A1X7V0H4_AMPQE